MQEVNLEGTTFFYCTPSDFFHLEEHDVGDYKPLQGWKLFSVFGTKEDFDYAKTNLEKEYSEVEIYIPRRHLLQGLGCINHSGESPEFNEFKLQKNVRLRMLCFGSQPKDAPTISRIVSEYKIKCRA